MVMLLSIISTFFFLADYSTKANSVKYKILPKPRWEDFPMVVPAVEREGHSWKIPVDATDRAQPDLAIAVAIHNNEILFSSYDEKKGKAYFWSPHSSGRLYTKNQFFLLHQDFMELVIKPFEDLSSFLGNKDYAGTADNSTCLAVAFKVDDEIYVPLLDKPGNRSDKNTVKKIGTYLPNADVLFYWDKKENKPFIHYGVKDWLGSEKRRRRAEFFCRRRYRQ